ncbi:Small ribosomal subunit protein S13, mitochondrial [Linum perenne]
MLGLGRRSLSDVSQRLLQNVALRCQQVQCLRIGNAEIPNQKRLETSLQYIHGIGRRRAHQMLVDLSIQNKLTKDLTGVELNNLKEEVSRYLTGGDLKRCVSADVQKLIDSGCYRGIRHIDMLPCRGQRTKTNARTRKEHSKQLGKVPNAR